MIDVPELLPCPFCGGENLEMDWRHSGAQVVCINCLVKGPREASKNEAASSWNTRTDIHAAALIEAERRGMMRAAEIARLGEIVEAAYIQGAMDVHNNFEPCRDPDFSEAASDYAAALKEQQP